MKPDPTQARRMLHWFGSGLGIAGILFVALKLAQYREQIDLARLGAEDWFVLLLLAIACGLSGLLLALGWRALLQHHGVTIAPAAAIRIYGISQIAKYVPSNVVHLIGRQALAVAESLPAWPVAKSTVWELGVLLCAAALFVPLALPFVAPEWSQWLAALLFVACAMLAVLLVRRTLGTHAATALCAYAGFLGVSSVSFCIVLLLLVPDAALAPYALGVCGAYVLGWVAGFVTPGAPAGVGVREMALYFLLAAFVDQADLLAAVVLARMVSVSGDVLFYLGAVGTRRGINAGVTP